METALEFYRKELAALVSTGKTEFKTEQELFEKAKEKEKCQIENAWDRGHYIGSTFPNGNIENIYEQDQEQYYNETYNN